MPFHVTGQNPAQSGVSVLSSVSGNAYLTLNKCYLHLFVCVCVCVRKKNPHNPVMCNTEVHVTVILVSDQRNLIKCCIPEL